MSAIPPPSSPRPGEGPPFDPSKAKEESASPTPAAPPSSDHAKPLSGKVKKLGGKPLAPAMKALGVSQTAKPTYEVALPHPVRNAPNGINDPNAPETKEKIRKFIHHHDPEYHEALQAIFDATDYISQDAFDVRLDAVIEELNEVLPSNESFLMLAKTRKSNVWVTAKAVPKLNNPPASIVNLRSMHVEEALKAHPDCRSIVIADDGSYSGEQMFLSIREHCVQPFERLGRKDYTIFIAVPFMTRFAKEKILESEPPNGKVVIMNHTTMPSMREQVPEKHHASINKLYFFRENYPSLEKLASFSSTAMKLAFFKGSPERINLQKLIESKGVNAFELLQQLNHLENEVKEANRLHGNKPGFSEMDLMRKLVENPLLIELSDKIVARIEELNQQYPGQLIGADDLEDWKAIDHLRGLDSRTLTIFDHKIADGFSTCPGFESGIICSNSEEVQIYGVTFDTPYQIPFFTNNPPYRE
jgi:hypothetical protein